MRRLLIIASFLVSTLLLAGCSGTRYHMIEQVKVPKNAKVGVLQQVKCYSKCTNPEGPTIYSEALRSRLEDKLGRPVSLVTVPSGSGFDGSDSGAAELGKKAGVDYVVGGVLYDWYDPSTFERTAKLLFSVATVLLPVQIIVSPKTIVASQIDIIRVSDGKNIGGLGDRQIGGSFNRCAGMTADMADVVAENQFE